LLHYGRTPPGDLTAEEQAWCRQRIAEAGLAEDRK
jgi:hypothetical protein